MKQTLSFQFIKLQQIEFLCQVRERALAALSEIKGITGHNVDFIKDVTLRNTHVYDAIWYICMKPLNFTFSLIRFSSRFKFIQKYVG